jgi:hypothetical protein
MVKSPRYQSYPFGQGWEQVRVAGQWSKLEELVETTIYLNGATKIPG